MYTCHRVIKSASYLCVFHLSQTWYVGSLSTRGREIRPLNDHKGLANTNWYIAIEGMTDHPCTTLHLKKKLSYWESFVGNLWGVGPFGDQQKVSSFLNILCTQRDRWTDGQTNRLYNGMCAKHTIERYLSLRQKAKGVERERV